jgi:RNA polymerase sigma-70 factor (ECF subfamily)
MLQQARAGDVEAFAALFEPLRSKIHAVAVRMVGPADADDVVMETYLKAWGALPRFGGRSALGTWLCRIARNQALDMLRKRQRHSIKEVHGEDAELLREREPDPSQPTAVEQIMRAETQASVREALDCVPEPHRTTLLMRFVDDLSYSEIAAAMQVSIGTVMSRLHNAKHKLRAALDELTALRDQPIKDAS